MEHPKRITGFMAFARDMINDTPGLTAQEVYSLAMQYSEEMGVRLSAAANPEASLVATLHKGHSDYGLERRRGKDGKLRFYPEGQAPGEDLANQPLPRPAQQQSPTVEWHSSQEIAPCKDGCCIELLSDDSMAIKLLVTRGLYPDEHAAHRDLVKKGLEVVFGKLKTAI